MSSQDIYPQGQATNLDSGQKGRGVLRIARRNTAPSLEMKKGIFHQVTQPVEGFVVGALLLAVLPGRDVDLGAPAAGLVDKRIAVVPPVRHHVPGLYPFNQLVSHGAIRRGT